MKMKLTQPITAIKGVGPAIAAKLALLGVQTVKDLLYFFPRRYDDFSHLTSIDTLTPGAVTVKARVEKVTARHVRRGLHITEAILDDGTGKARAVWFNQPYRPDSLKDSGEFYFSGTFDFQRDRFVLQNPAVEKVKALTKNTARIVPVYPQVQGLKSHQLRQFLQTLLPEMAALPETLPSGICADQKLMPLGEALRQIHFPDNDDTLQAARHRLAFEELFEVLLAAALNKSEHQALSGWAAPYQQAVADRFTHALGFQLTNAQRRASWEILQDIAGHQPMNRMLQGDVGAGKTAVAAMAACMAQASDLQTAVMAPTEVLAVQHAASLANLLQPLGIEVGLLIGATKPKARQLLQSQIAKGGVHVVVGTHALIQEDVAFARLGLVVIDEQHRFGVAQRQKLLAKSRNMPHLLAMTATPIPRSLTLTVYGELDISILDELPPGRTPIITEIHSPHSLAPLYAKIDTEITAGRQVYIICPLVSDSDTLGVKSVETEHQRLTTSVFKHRRIGLLHGKLSSAEKDTVMRQFKDGKLDILVATTVVEVGVDVPNATIMLIEGAERFGLAQLHQLRGRVGRGHHQSYCYLVPSTAKQPSARLRELANSNDGFYLAEADLRLRGPGEIYGTRQHGALDLRLVKITDTAFIRQVQQSVITFLGSQPDLSQFPELHSRVEQLRRLTVLN